jgi:monovalent cation:H+ antiporter-2, CPA2 family
MVSIALTLLEAPAHGGSSYVRDLLILLTAAAVVAVAARRIRLASIPGYLLLGALIGPSAFGAITTDENVKQISDLAIILLMFTIGLHLDLDAIRSGMVRILAVGVVSTVLVSLVLWPLGMLFGLSAPVALVVAMAFSMSSTAVMMAVLNQRREVHRIHGRICIGVSVTQDLLSIVVLALLPVIAVWAGVHGQTSVPADAVGISRPLRMIADASLAVGGIGVMLAFGRYVLPTLLREASRDGNTEGLLVLSAFVAIAAAIVSAYLGFGSSLGAFLAGFILASTPFRHQLAGQLSPMRDLFMAVFFTAVGIKMDLGAVAAYWWVILLAVVVLVAVKGAIIAVSCWAGGATAAVSALVGFACAQAGEFSLVIFDAAVGQGVITTEQLAPIIGVVVTSLIIATMLFDLGYKLAPRLARVPTARWIQTRALREADPGGKPAPSKTAAPPTSPIAALNPDGSPRHVIIAGFGPVGRSIADEFQALGVPFIIVELNAETVRKQRKLGRTVVFGDIANEEVLRSAGVERALGVVVSIPDQDAAVRACQSIRRVAPETYIAVRAPTLSKANAAAGLGADSVTVEELVTAKDMTRKVVDELSGRFGLRTTHADQPDQSAGTVVAPDPAVGRVVIAGFGLVGRNVAGHLEAAGIDYTVIELNPRTVWHVATRGKEAIYGDVSNPEVLESAGARTARAVVLTIPDDEATVRACKLIREMNPTAVIAARVSYLARAGTAMEQGADLVTAEEDVTAQEMAKRVMARLRR